MSAVYFHTPDAEARLSGPERAYASQIVSKITLALLESTLEQDRAQLLALVPRTHYLHAKHWDGWWDTFGTAWRVDLSLEWRGRPFESWVVSLNTALAIGSDPIKLLARMHGQCEVHGWVDGPNRAWLAGIIARGLRDDVYRDGMGWQDVAKLLWSTDATPVVMSYSVTDAFPNPHIAGVENEQDQEDWYGLPSQTQWEWSMAGLRANPWLEITPETWDDYRFVPELTAFDLLAGDRDNRLDRALCR